MVEEINQVKLRVELAQRIGELEEKMNIPLPSKDVINNINELSRDIRQRINFLKKNNVTINIEERRFNRVLSDKEWPLN